MIKRSVEISQAPAHLSVRYGQLQLKRDGELVDSLPIEDLGIVVVDHPQSTYTHAALTELVARGAVVVLCGPNHLPSGILLPVSDHCLVVERLRTQTAVSLPTKKNVWRQLVKAKILAQAANLQPASPSARRLRAYAQDVRSGDSSNREAHAARVYWAAWLMQSPQADEDLAPFRRDPDGTGLNSLLNYGYAIVRAAVARAIVAAGLQPALGVHHSNRSNAFCLADDLIEPLRPMVDAVVRDLAFAGEDSLTQPVKAALLNILIEEVSADGVAGPLMVALQRYVASLVDVFEGTTRQLSIPVRCDSVPTAACGS